VTTKLNQKRRPLGIAAPRSRTLLKFALVAGIACNSSGQLSAQQDGQTLPEFPATAIVRACSADAVALPIGCTSSHTRPSNALHAKLLALIGLKKQPAVVNAPFAIPCEGFQVTTASCEVAQEGELPAKLSTQQESTDDRVGQKEPEIRLSTGQSISHFADSQAGTSEPSTLTAAVDMANSLMDIEVAETARIESLLDIEIPLGIAQTSPPSNETNRVPEIVKSKPAMQLNVGPTPSLLSAAETIPTSGFESSNSPIVTIPAIIREEVVQHSAIEMRLNDADEAEYNSNSQDKPQPKLLSMRIESEAQDVPLEQALPQTQTHGEDRVASSQMVVAATSTSTPDAVIGKPLDVPLHESHVVASPSPIANYSVEHPEFCQAIKNGDKSLSLVGLKPGKTRIAIFTATDSGATKIEIREVTIAGSEQSAPDLKSLTDSMSKTIAKMFPASSIEIVSGDDGLVVQGFAESEAEAKKIIRMIRKTSLQPVIDRLVSYK
jgi:Pilus formation protein N terminal region